MAGWQETVTATFLLVIVLFADFSLADGNGTTTVAQTTVTTEPTAQNSSTLTSTEAYNGTTTHESGNFTLTTTTFDNVTTAFTGNFTTGTFETTTDGNVTVATVEPVSTVTTTTPGSGQKFDAGSFFGGFSVAVAFGVIVIGLWKLYQTRQRERPYFVFDT